MKVAILGGSFNPPHSAHLFIAESVLSILEYDKVIFIPAKKPAHKQLQGNASNEDRLNMTKLLIEHNSSFTVDDFEIKDETSSYSYTVNTLEYLYQKYDDIEGRIGLIIGADLIPDFQKWNKADTILKMSNIIAIGRGSDDNLDPHIIAKYNMKVLEVMKCDTSSTMIREHVSNGFKISHLVCDKVNDYIVEHRLYI